MSVTRSSKMVAWAGCLILALPGWLNAQSAKENAQEVTRTWRVGAHIQSPAKPVTGLVVTFPIPTDWPEQHVNVYQENIPKEARSADFRDSDSIRQMVARIPKIEPNTEVEINVILDITVSAIPYPERTDHLVKPKRPPKDVRLSLNPSPLIESRGRAMRNQVKELVGEIDSPWEQTRAIYDFVTTEIDVEGRTVVGAEKALRDKKGAAEDRTNVFVALCRVNKVPARIVWASGSEYAEFYLQDDTGAGRWYPAVLEGKTEFGQMSNPSVIIQKGDNIKVPEKSQRQRFVVEFVTGNGANGARPKVRFLRDVLPARDRTDSQNSR